MYSVKETRSYANDSPLTQEQGPQPLAFQTAKHAESCNQCKSGRYGLSDAFINQRSLNAEKPLAKQTISFRSATLPGRSANSKFMKPIGETVFFCERTC